VFGVLESVFRFVYQQVKHKFHFGLNQPGENKRLLCAIVQLIIEADRTVPHSPLGIAINVNFLLNIYQYHRNGLKDWKSEIV